MINSSYQAIIEIVSSIDDIETISLIEFPNVSPLQERLDVDALDSQAVQTALKIRSELNLPFWDSLLVTQFKEQLFSNKILNQALFHNPVKNRITIARENITSIEDFAFNKKKNYGFNSVVLSSKGKVAHLPLLDFHIPYSPSNNLCVEHVINLLSLKGYLFKTNKSYHFIGNSLILEQELRLLLYKALLLSPIIDKNWVSHQLIENSCTLRITLKDGHFPTLIKEI